MRNVSFPLSLTFKIGTLANDFVIKDVNGITQSYVRQKMFKLKEDIICYTDETKTKSLYRIKADRWIDFSATYTFTNAEEKEIGKVGRKGLASIWKARYEVFNSEKNCEFLIKEENAWTKVLDAIFTQIPIVGIFTGYFFNPKYIVTNAQNEILFRLQKEPSFFGRRFTLHKFLEPGEEQQERIILSLMMMILLERRRG